MRMLERVAEAARRSQRAYDLLADAVNLAPFNDEDNEPLRAEVSAADDALRTALSALPASAGSDETRDKLQPEALPAGEVSERGQAVLDGIEAKSAETRDLLAPTPSAAVSGEGAPDPNDDALDATKTPDACPGKAASRPPAASDEERAHTHKCDECHEPFVPGVCGDCVRAEATEAERERCARIADEVAGRTPESDRPTRAWATAAAIAKGIRQRAGKDGG